MTDHSGAELGPLAAALIASTSPNLERETEEALGAAVVEIATVHAREYLERDGDELYLAMARIIGRQVPGVDTALVAWLGRNPSRARLGVASNALWYLWSYSGWRSLLEPNVVRDLLRAGRLVPIGWTEIGPYRTALSAAAKLVTDEDVLAIITQEIAGLSDETMVPEVLVDLAPDTT